MKRNARSQTVAKLSRFCCFVSSVQPLQYERWKLLRVVTFAPAERQIVHYLLNDVALKCPPCENFGMAIANTLSVASLFFYEQCVSQKIRPHSKSKDQQVIVIDRFIAVIVALEMCNNRGDAGLPVGLTIGFRDGPLVGVQ